ncbi:Deoxyguanosinetriphosphate triphosphohydrolase-like protein [Rhodospirillaceae bacterium LM-1]|nr:Deoxyguanosinetriphosphate triphosphohydrolase-like protein [Rhodospirillaceae bacterium LM-1]
MPNASDLALFASKAADSRGRLYPEAESRTRSAFQRDRDRIIHSAAFRRLQYKTQVFVYHEGDNFRTRLTHSLEVAQIARSISRQLKLDEDLAEALALAHDLGHPPFGHAGEDALKEAMQPFGGFDHNAQSLRVVTSLETRYPGFDGLNLAWETLEGLVKHNGPLKQPMPAYIGDYQARHDLELASWPSAEAQVAALSDDIAYNNHDVEDGLRAGLFSLDDLKPIFVVGPMFDEIAARYPGLDQARLIHTVVRELIGAMVEDLVAETRRRIDDAQPSSAADVRALGRPLVGFSAQMQQADRELKKFLFAHMYRHYKVNRMTSKARRVVRDLFALFLAEPECLPEEWRVRASAKNSPETALLVCDYVAGMTDRFALEEHRRLFDLQVTP